MSNITGYDASNEFMRSIKKKKKKILIQYTKCSGQIFTSILVEAIGQSCSTLFKHFQGIQIKRHEDNSHALHLLVFNMVWDGSESNAILHNH